MIFSSFRFLVFFPCVLLLYFASRNLRWRHWVLLVASWIFYGSWDPRFLALLLGSTLLDYSVGLGLGRARSAAVRRALLCVSITGNLGALAFFKYCNFFVGSLRELLAFVGSGFDPVAATAAATGLPHDPATGLLAIVLPVGISFYSFQTLSYAIDVYRRELEPTRDFVQFALFVAFFPQLVAGPIVRAVEFLPQLKRHVLVRWEDVSEGIQRFAIGFAKKVFIADNIAAYVDGVFARSGDYDGGTLWLGSIGFAVQVYCDFSGYTDMAIGAGRIMGFYLPENFRFPFTAVNVADFWRRWHITLYSFMRDYLYVPLGGSRVSPGRRLFNVLLTMTLVGLWHGAAWQFVLWGFFNGLLVTASVGLTQLIAARPRLSAGLGSPPGVVLRVALVNLVFFFGLGIFRSQGMDAVLLTMARMLGLDGGGATWFDPWILAAYAVVLAGCIAAELDLFERLRNATPAVLQPVAWVALIVFLTLFCPDDTAAFVYFQF
ncbi:MAG TPA: MBOAT family O-acyltransferase [Planctomycetota bacterium]|nr:MBOAT family O-acyltransferase [Planctomycetota bacterium]